MRKVLDTSSLRVLLKFAVLAWLPCAILGWADVAHAQESATEIVAVAVRQHGHVCENPQSAEPDHQNTTPDEKAWTIRCENGSYRVKFMGGSGAEVEPLDD